MLTPEFRKQDERDLRHGLRHLPSGTGGPGRLDDSQAALVRAQEAQDEDDGTWQVLLEQSMCEAFAEADPVRLRAALVRLGALACEWIEDLDREGSA